MLAFAGGTAGLPAHVQLRQAPAPVSRASQSANLPDFTALAGKGCPAVVNVSTVRYDSKGSGRKQEADPLEDFLRRFAPPVPGDQGPDSGTIGSGFIIDAEGRILTNAHVVVDADEILVKLTDKREIRARLIGLNAPTDIALMKIDAPDLVVLPTGDASRLEVGEWVMAIGSPFGVDSSVSVGINAQIFSRSRGYMGISFAMPINIALEVKEALKKSGRVVRGRLGIVTQDINSAQAASF